MKEKIIQNIGFVSLGCPKNQIDTEIMLSLVVNAGYNVTEDIHADVMIVNTCAFIEDAKKEAIDNILDLAWLKENKSLKGIIVCGCLSERYKDEIFTRIPEVDAVVGVGSIKNIVEAVEAVEKQYKSFAASPQNCNQKEKYISILPNDKLELGGDRILTTPEYMAYIKIAEGCDNRCSYCAIPLIRGGLRSRTVESVVEEAKDLAAAGVKELIVTSQDTTSYGIDLYGEYKLPELLRELCKIEGFKWIRLLYCYPGKMTDELIDVIKSEPKILKYIDIPIQHINDRILSAMNRKGGRSAIEANIKKLRAEIPDIVIRSTVIVGFPGETKGEFDELLAFADQTGFERLGAFAYSAEEDTPAGKFPGQVTKKAKERRLDAIMSAQERKVFAFNEKRIGKIEEIVCEGFDEVGEVYYGRSAADAPEIDCKVYFYANRRIAEGEFVNVKIEKIIDFDVIGQEEPTT